MQTDIELSKTSDVLVVETDVDMFVLLIQLAQTDKSNFLFKNGIGKCPDMVTLLRNLRTRYEKGFQPNSNAS